MPNPQPETPRWTVDVWRIGNAGLPDASFGVQANDEAGAVHAAFAEARRRGFDEERIDLRVRPSTIATAANPPRVLHYHQLTNGSLVIGPYSGAFFEDDPQPPTDARTVREPKQSYRARVLAYVAEQEANLPYDDDAGELPPPVRAARVDALTGAPQLWRSAVESMFDEGEGRARDYLTPTVAELEELAIEAVRRAAYFRARENGQAHDNALVTSNTAVISAAKLLGWPHESALRKLRKF